MRPISEKGATLLEDIQPELRDDPFVQQAFDVLGRELQRVEDAINGAFFRVFPQHADDLYRTLSMYEWLLRLPVAPNAVALLERQNNVIANIRKRHSGSGSDWVAALSAVLGNTWSHLEGPGDYQVTITIPYEAGGFSSGQVEILARRITPANLQILVAYEQGFLVGISRVGLDPL